VHLVDFIVRIYHDARSSECHATFIVGGGIAAVAKNANCINLIISLTEISSGSCW